ncbi:CHAT domain-containing protein [Egicoccus sp. AB-alg2]|uniref:CHAT domain-containing protein n=1 Tax=Egicoccus sp. AB-alg2 TaxID=3242693 RepID=UPI00359D1884
MTPPRAADAAIEDLIDAAIADPIGVRDRAPALLANHTGDPSKVVRIRWALGLALRELGELTDARRELQAAAAVADGLPDAPTAALVRSSLALVLLHLGDGEAALAQTVAAADDLVDEADAARNEMQRGLILQRLGRHEQAVAAYDVAEPALRRTGDHAALARLLSNRGVLHAYAGTLGPATGDLEESVALARRLGATRGAAFALQNLGFVAGRAGRLLEGLQRLEEADRLLRQVDEDAPTLAVLDMDRAEVLADTGLLDEALERAVAAAAAFEDVDDQTNLAEAELLVARLRLLAGHPVAAASLAEQARARFAAAHRDGWELQARYVAMAARARDGAVVDAAAAGRLADELAAGGWQTEARVARLLAARHALEAGDPAGAESHLARVRDGARRAPALARAQHWYATALLRRHHGDAGGARRAVAAGLAALHRSRLVFGSAELRAHAARHTTELVELGVRLALQAGRPADALRALDAVRAMDLAVPPRPPADPELADLLGQLRRLHADEQDAARSGDGVEAARRLRADVERRIRDRARLLAHETAGVAAPSLDVGELGRTLAGRTLVAYLNLDDRLHLLTVTGRDTRHVPLGPIEEVRTGIVHLRSALRRLAHGRGSTAALAAADASIARSVDDLLARLGLDRVPPEGLVVVPTGALDGLPWGALVPALGQGPEIAPSALGWLAAARRGEAGGPDVLVAGPGLPGAAEEVAELAARLPGARVLTGSDATAAAVLQAMEGAGTVHLAAHGRFRADNPLFSELRLADGPLTVYELEGLRRAPATLVLPSCEAAASATLAGDAVLGLGSVLLRLGVRTLVAPVLEIPDAATRPLMVDLHARRAAGATPAAALGAAVADAADATPRQRAVRSSFALFGASDVGTGGAGTGGAGTGGSVPGW